VSFQFAFVLPTTRCLAHCEFCFYETGHSERVEARDYIPRLGPALEALQEEGLQQVIITGGEPLLAPLFPDLLELLSQHVVHVLLLTHGELLDEEKLELLERQGVDDITISAVGPEEQLRQTIHRIMFHSRYVPTLLTCLNRSNLDDVPRLLEFSSRRNLPHLFTPAYIPQEAGCFDRLSLHRVPEREWRELIDRLQGWAEATQSLFYLAMIRDFYRGMPVHPGFCPMGTQGLVVDADGTVYPCFHRHDLRAGNLIADPWPQIRDRLEQVGPGLIGAPCFGEHCLSMFAGVQE